MARPRLALTAKMIRQIRLLAGYGLTNVQIAAVLEISHDTLARRKETSAKVLEALEAGHAVAQAMVARALLVKAVNGDVAAIRWYEITRAGRCAHVRNELTGKEGVPK